MEGEGGKRGRETDRQTDKLHFEMGKGERRGGRGEKEGERER